MSAPKRQGRRSSVVMLCSGRNEAARLDLDGWMDGWRKAGKEPSYEGVASHVVVVLPFREMPVVNYRLSKWTTQRRRKKGFFFYTFFCLDTHFIFASVDEGLWNAANGRFENDLLLKILIRISLLSSFRTVCLLPVANISTAVAKQPKERR